MQINKNYDQSIVSYYDYSYKIFIRSDCSFILDVSYLTSRVLF